MCICRSGKYSSWNIFALSFLRKIEISATHCRNSKCDAGQEIRSGPTKPGYISQWKFLGSQRTITELIRAVTGESEFSTANNLQVVKEENIEGKKACDGVNDSKQEVNVKYLPTLDCCLFLCAKQMGSCFTVQGTTVTGAVLSAMGFCGFFVHITMLPPLTFKTIVMVALSPFPYVTDLAADM